MASPRLFDHDEAVRLHAAGESVSALAEKYGVTWNAIWFAIKRATDPQWRVENNEYMRLCQWERRTPCEGGCGRLVWTQTHKEASGYCARCLAEQKHGANVRGATLRCTRCGEWKPDHAFHFRRGRTAHLRRGRKTWCRACESKARQEYRDRKRVPCAKCGEPRTAPSENTTARFRGFKDSGLCRKCYATRRTAA